MISDWICGEKNKGFQVTEKLGNGEIGAESIEAGRGVRRRKEPEKQREKG